MPACARLASVALASPLWQVVHVSVFFGWASSIPRWQSAHWSGRVDAGDASADASAEAASTKEMTGPEKTPQYRTIRLIPGRTVSSMNPDGDIACGGIRRDDVGFPVGVEVRDRYSGGTPGRGETQLGLEGSVSVAEENRKSIRASRDDVDDPVGVHVGHGQPGQSEAGGETLLSLEGPVAVAEVNRDIVRGEIAGGAVGGDEVELAVPVQVGDGDGQRKLAGRDADLGLEGPIPVAEEDRDVVGPEVGDHQVELAVAVQVGHDDGARLVTDDKALLGLEGPVTIPEQDRDVVAVDVRGDHVGDAVAIQIGHRHGPRVAADGEPQLRLEGAIAIAE